MSDVFHGSFSCVEDIIREFGCGADSTENEEIRNELKDAEILFAIYATGYYEGEAFVLYRKDNKLYRVDSSHCSCHGLEGSWSPIETDESMIKDEFERYLKDNSEEYYSDERRWRQNVLNRLEETKTCC